MREIAFLPVCLMVLIQTGCGDIKESLQEPFTTALLNNPSSVRFLAFGDSGVASRQQFNVAESAYRICQIRKCNFAIHLGDIILAKFYVAPVTPYDFYTKWELPYSQFGSFHFYAVPGNHDWYQRIIADELLYSQRSQTLEMPATYYAIPGLPSWLHMVGLDTETLYKRQPEFARKALCNKSGWKVVFGHHPIVSNGGSHGSRWIRRFLEPVIHECGVQFYFSGHDHHQEHIDLGSYQQIIQGGGGQALGFVTKTREDNQRFKAVSHGFAIAQVSENSFELTFYNAQGREIYYFTY